MQIYSLDFYFCFPWSPVAQGFHLGREQGDDRVDASRTEPGSPPARGNGEPFLRLGSGWLVRSKAAAAAVQQAAAVRGRQRGEVEERNSPGPGTRRRPNSTRVGQSGCLWARCFGVTAGLGRNVHVGAVTCRFRGLGLGRRRRGLGPSQPGLPSWARLSSQ